MKTLLSMITGAVLAIAIQACATADLFPYPHYGVDMKDLKLLADTTHGLPDAPLSICDSTPASASPCIAFMEADYLRLKQDFINQGSDLVACQKQLAAQ